MIHDWVRPQPGLSLPFSTPSAYNSSTDTKLSSYSVPSLFLLASQQEKTTLTSLILALVTMHHRLLPLKRLAAIDIRPASFAPLNFWLTLKSISHPNPCKSEANSIHEGCSSRATSSDGSFKPDFPPGNKLPPHCVIASLLPRSCYCISM